MGVDEGRARFWTVFGVVALNLVFFIGATSNAFFRALHHHWIFPVLGGLFALQWALAGGLAPRPVRTGPLDLAAARATLLSILAFLVLMGVVRHFSILTCFGRCSLKLGSAAALAGVVFLLQSRAADRALSRGSAASGDLGAADRALSRGSAASGDLGAAEAHLWGRDRSLVAAAGCLLWAGYLFLYGLQPLSPPVRDGSFLALGAWLLVAGGRRPWLRLVGGGTLAGVLIGWTCSEVPAIFLGLALAVGALFAAGRLTGSREAGTRAGR